MQILLYKVYFSQKQFFGELIVFRHLNMDFTIFLRVILSEVSNLSLSFKKKHNCEVKKIYHVHIDQTALSTRFNNKILNKLLH